MNDHKGNVYDTVKVSFIIRKNNLKRNCKKK